MLKFCSLYLQNRELGNYNPAIEVLSNIAKLQRVSWPEDLSAMLVYSCQAWQMVNGDGNGKQAPAMFCLWLMATAVYIKH